MREIINEIPIEAFIFFGLIIGAIIANYDINRIYKKIKKDGL
jgi:hypothetical protein